MKALKGKKQIYIVIGIMCFLLTIGISIQIKTISNANTVASQSLKENKLRDEVLKWKERYDNKYSEFEKAEIKLEEERKKSTQNSEASIAMEEDLKKSRALLGLTEVKGEGVIISLHDNQKVNKDMLSPLDSIGNYLVHNTDIMRVVNELKNAGAEAISINGQRVVNSTEITCIGNVILINKEKIGAPYEIKAIGNASMLKDSLERPGGYVENLEQYGVYGGMKKYNNISIPKFEGVYNVVHSKIIKE